MARPELFFDGHDKKPGFAQALRPAEVCQALLAALDAADGRRRKRKRDQTPDAIGLSIKRSLLERAVQDDPNPEASKNGCWITRECATLESSGAVSAMARAFWKNGAWLIPWTTLESGSSRERRRMMRRMKNQENGRRHDRR